MHWVHRGPEPIRLEPIKKRQTPSWVTCYSYGQGRPPTYHGWTSFRDDLKLAFDGLCAYCEQYTSGEVDHFRPKSLFPKEVYDWSNWVFSCRPCNQAKGENWPTGGYVDPCALGSSDRPEHYFDFSLRLGRITLRAGLSNVEKSKARNMIKDLKLNEWYQVQERKNWIKALDKLAGPSLLGVLASVRDFARRSVPLSSVTRAWLEGRGYPV